MSVIALRAKQSPSMGNVHGAEPKRREYLLELRYAWHALATAQQAVATLMGPPGSTGASGETWHPVTAQVYTLVTQGHQFAGATTVCGYAHEGHDKWRGVGIYGRIRPHVGRPQLGRIDETRAQDNQDFARQQAFQHNWTRHNNE